MTGASETLALYKRLVAYTRPYGARLRLGILFGVLYGPTNVAVLAVVKKLWAKVFEQPETVTLTGAVLVALLLPAAMIARGLCDFSNTYLLSWVGLRAVNDLRVRVFDHLQRLSLDYYSSARTGELMARIINDAERSYAAVSSVLEDIVKEPVTLVSVLIYLLYTDWKLTLVGLVLFPVTLVPIVVYGKRMRRSSRASQDHLAAMSSVLQEAVTGARVVKAFGMEDRETLDFSDTCRRVFTERMRGVRARTLNTPIIEVVAGLGAAMVCLYAYRIGMEGSAMVTFGLGMFMLYAPVKKLGRMHMTIQEALGATEKLLAVLDEKPTVREHADPKPLPRLSREIAFDHVHFHYAADGTDSEIPVLADVHLTVRVGELVAVVGGSGSLPPETTSGKSSIDGSRSLPGGGPFPSLCSVDRIVMQNRLTGPGRRSPVDHPYLTSCGSSGRTACPCRTDLTAGDPSDGARGMPRSRTACRCATGRALPSTSSHRPTGGLHRRTRRSGGASS